MNSEFLKQKRISSSLTNIIIFWIFFSFIIFFLNHIFSIHFNIVLNLSSFRFVADLTTTHRPCLVKVFSVELSFFSIQSLVAKWISESEDVSFSFIVKKIVWNYLKKLRKNIGWFELFECAKKVVKLLYLKQVFFYCFFL